jgi:hypothetical protein
LLLQIAVAGGRISLRILLLHNVFGGENVADVELLSEIALGYMAFVKFLLG